MSAETGRTGPLLGAGMIGGAGGITLAILGAETILKFHNIALGGGELVGSAVSDVFAIYALLRRRKILNENTERLRSAGATSRAMRRGLRL